MSDGPRPAATCVVVFRADGRFLMVRRAPTVMAPGYWTPVTGKLAPGEDSAAAGVREVAEEVGLRVVVAPEVVFTCPTSNGLFELRWHVADAIEPLAALGEVRWRAFPGLLATTDPLGQPRSRRPHSWPPAALRPGSVRGFSVGTEKPVRRSRSLSRIAELLFGHRRRG